MADITISEGQLETWARYIQLNKNAETYKKVKEIFHGKYFNRSKRYEIYLQGSVANRTNIWADGDIDIIFQFNGTFCYEYNYHPSIYNNPSDYTQQQLRQDIKNILDRQSISYEEKNKCIKLFLRGDEWQNVDLVPCFQYRKHYGRVEYEYYEGIAIRTLNGELIINYPKQHRENGEQKNKRSGYKNMVRIFKNIRNNLVDEGIIDENLAPSYFIECLIYNVPDDKFNENNFRSILCNCLNWLWKNDLQYLKCQNGITNLFGDENTQWDYLNYKRFIKEVIKYVTK